MTLVWTKDASGDWYASGEGGRLYRYHTLAGLHVGRLPLIAMADPRSLDWDQIESVAQAFEDEQARKAGAA